MKLYIYVYEGGVFKEQVVEAKECAKTYTLLEDTIGYFYKGRRIGKEDIGCICGWRNSAIILLEENRNLAIERFISEEKMQAELAKKKYDSTKEHISYLENLK